MSNYHITQEQAEALWDKVSLNLSKGQCMQQAYANAVLDKVLGEPVGEIIGDRWKSMQFLASLKRSDVNKLPDGTKLYAPKEQP